MGHFRLNLLGVGGHGCQRDIGDGEHVVGCERPNCPDCILRECVRRLKRSGVELFRAELTHWPADEPNLGYSKENEVRDDLLGGKRSGEFPEAAEARARKEGWFLTVKVRGGSLDGHTIQVSINEPGMTIRDVVAKALGKTWPAKKPDGTEATYDLLVADSAGAGRTETRRFRFQAGSPYPQNMVVFPTAYQAQRAGVAFTIQEMGANVPVL